MSRATLLKRVTKLFDLTYVKPSHLRAISERATSPARFGFVPFCEKNINTFKVIPGRVSIQLLALLHNFPNLQFTGIKSSEH